MLSCCTCRRLYGCICLKLYVTGTVPPSPLSGSVAWPFWGRWSVPVRRQGNPTTDSPIAARLDSFRVYDYNYSVHTCYILDLQTRSLQSVLRVEDSRGLQFVSAILSSLDNFPAQPCACRRHIGAVSTSRLTFQPHWLLVVRSASILVLGNQPSASTSPLKYSYLSIRIWPTTSQTSRRHYTNTKSS